jgi:hypothetical protein
LGNEASGFLSTLFQSWIVAVGFLIILLVDVHRKAASAATGGSTREWLPVGEMYASASTRRTKERCAHLAGE